MDLDQASRLAEMALDMTEQPDLPRTLDRILGRARLSIPCDAVGVLLQRYGRAETAATDEVADEAFSVLRRYSQNKNVKLRSIAEQVVSTHDLPD